MSWFGGVIKQAKINKLDLGYINPAKGTPMVSEGIGIIKGTDDLKQAQKFIDWFGSAAFMSKYANKFGQTPSLPAAIKLSNDTIKTYAEMFDAQNINWEQASMLESSWLEKIQLDIL